MCLHKELLNFRWSSKKKRNIGIGYKNLWIDSLGKIYVRSGAIQEKVWLDASVTSSNSKNILDESYGPDYPLGFHIFLNPIHAKKYDLSPGTHIYEVEYYDVIGFGKQSYSDTQIGDCVIAQKMRIVKKLTQKEIKDCAAQVRRRYSN